MSADETIVTRFVVEAADAISEAQRFRSAVEEVKQKMIEMRQTTGLSFKDISVGLKEAYRAAMAEDLQGTEKLRQFNQVVNTATSELTKLGGTAPILSRLGGVLTAIFGVSFYGAIRSFVSLTKSAIEVSTEFAQDLFRLSASTRALQRMGVDIDMGRVIAQVKELRQEFSFFTTKDIVKGIGYIQLLSRNFGFTTDQMKEMMRVSTALAVLQGKDVGESARQLALFYSSGYAEALQRAGFAVNRLAVQEEAHRMGIDKNYTALTEQERAQAAHNLVMRQAASIMDEVNEYESSMAGKIAKATAQIEEQKNLIGYKLLPLKQGWLTIIGKLIDALSWFQQTTAKVGVALYSGIGTAILFLIELFKELQGGIDNFNLDNVVERTRKAADELKAKLEELAGIDIFAAYGKDYEGPRISFPYGEFSEEALSSLQSGLEEILVVQQDFEEASRRSWEDYQDAMREATQDYYDDMAEATREYYQRLEEIEQEYRNNVEKENLQYQQERAEIEQDYNDRLREAQEDYYYDELRAERRFQERMRRLREEFLFDLEDALRERDALQVLRLIRRYQLDKEQAEREAALERQERRERFQQELQDIQEQRERRLQELELEHQQRLEELKAQYERELELARQEFEERLAEIRAQWEEEKEELRRQYEEKMKDLERALEERIRQIILSLVKEGILTQQQLQTLARIWGVYLGPGGAVEGIVTYYNQIINNAIQSAYQNINLLELLLKRALDYANQIQSQADSAGSGGTGKQRGGYVGRGVYQLGEAGYEFVLSHRTARLLEQISGMPLTQERIIKMATSGGSGIDGMARILVFLSPGLEAKIIDNALSSASVEIRKALGL